MMMKTLIFCLLLSFSYTLIAQNKDETAIEAAIDEQMKAWNKGSIEDFMKTYYNSDSLMFAGSKGITYGWTATLKNYKRNYPNASVMGKLQLDLLDIKPLSPNYYFVTGKWHLTRKMGDTGGYFTLLFKKINGKWLIIVDHTS
jgi:ketosteroid isomerase-like protein